MPWNGSAPNRQAGRTDGVRTGDDVYAQQAAAPVSVDATLFDVHDTDLKDMINACYKKDGGNTATADLPMGGFKFTNVAEAAARNQFARFSQLQDNKGQYVGTVGGTADAITLTPSPAITAYVAGQRFTFIAGGDNTTAATVNVSGVGAKDIKRPDGSATALSAGDIISGAIADIEYDGTNFLLLSWSATKLLNDAAPQLAADLDTNGNDVAFDDARGITDDSGNEQLVFQKTATAVNHVEITNAAAGNDPVISAAGDDTDIDLVLAGKGTGVPKIGTSAVLSTTNINDLTEDTSPDFANDFIVTYDASAGIAKKVKLGIGAIVAIIEDQKTQNTAGQTLNTGSDQVRELNTLVYNRDSLVSLSSNRFTLPAGTWEIAWDAPFAPDSGSGRLHQSFLYNQTDSAVVARGMSSYLDTSVNNENGQQLSSGSAVVTIAGSKAFEIRSRVGIQSTTGDPANFGTEVYTRVTVRRA